MTNNLRLWYFKTLCKKSENQKTVHEEKSAAIFGVFAYFITKRVGSIVKMAMEETLMPFYYTVLKCMDIL